MTEDTQEIAALPENLPNVTNMSSMERINYIQLCRIRLQNDLDVPDEHLTNAMQALSIERSSGNVKRAADGKQDLPQMSLDDL